MAINLSDNIFTSAPKPTDSRYLNNLLPYASVSAANAAITGGVGGVRYTGLTVNVNGSEYWYKNGIADVDLILKSQGSGTITGATNGLTVVGKNISLGGTLTGATFIIDPFAKGLQYGGDYSGSFNQNSLITKQYADAIASGLYVHQAVELASTGNISLTGFTTIDGILVQNGWRVLAKNQLNPINNGVYDASVGVWSRSADFDGSPSGETVQGAYMFVITGNTNASTAWVLITPDPINIGVTPLTFALFNAVSDVVGGVDITVDMSGGTHTVNFDGASAAGNSLNWNGSQLGVNITGGTLATALNSKLDKTAFNIYSGNTLTLINTKASQASVAIFTGTTLPANYYNKIQINAYTGVTNTLIGTKLDKTTFNIYTGDTAIILNAAVTGGTNGIGKTGRNVCLGGVLLNNSVFDGTVSKFNLRYAGDYRTNFVNRSLPDVAYVTGYTTNAVTGFSLTYNNGLTKTGQCVGLGGTLCQSTTIDGNLHSYGLCFTCLQGFGVGFCGNGGYVADNRAGLNRKGLEYCADYSAGYNCLSLANAGFVTGCTTFESNHDKVRIITASGYTITDTDQFIGISGASNICLPASPVCGHRISISDVCGNALTEPITICGNGKNILDNVYATINSDYGSLTMVYLGQAISKWSAIAFNN